MACRGKRANHVIPGPGPSYPGFWKPSWQMPHVVLMIPAVRSMVSATYVKDIDVSRACQVTDLHCPNP